MNLKAERLSFDMKNDTFNNSSIVVCVFTAVVMFLPSHCLAMIEGYTYRQTNWWE
jgi:hypothetical protein